MRLRVLLLLLLLLLLLATPRFAVAASLPDLSGLAYEQRLGAQLPRQNMLRDDTGRTVRLADLCEGKPLILALVYFHCSDLCTVGSAVERRRGGCAPPRGAS